MMSDTLAVKLDDVAHPIGQVAMLFDIGELRPPFVIYVGEGVVPSRLPQKLYASRRAWGLG